MSVLCPSHAPTEDITDSIYDMFWDMYVNIMRDAGVRRPLLQLIATHRDVNVDRQFYRPLTVWLPKKGQV